MNRMQSTDLPRESLQPIDWVYAALRGSALVIGVTYAYLARGERHDDVLLAFGVFAIYGSLVYSLLFRELLDPSRRARFYAALGGADLVFVLLLMQLTGGEASPFYRALYLWVAMPAFYFGMRTGTLASAVAFVALVVLFDVSTQSPWEFLVKAGALLLHGPLIGFLVDRDRENVRRVRELEAALQSKPER